MVLVEIKMKLLTWSFFSLSFFFDSLTLSGFGLLAVSAGGDCWVSSWKVCQDRKLVLFSAWRETFATQRLIRAESFCHFCDELYVFYWVFVPITKVFLELCQALHDAQHHV